MPSAKRQASAADVNTEVAALAKELLQLKEQSISDCVEDVKKAMGNVQQMAAEHDQKRAEQADILNPLAMRIKNSKSILKNFCQLESATPQALKDQMFEQARTISEDAVAIINSLATTAGGGEGAADMKAEQHPDAKKAKRTPRTHTA